MAKNIAIVDSLRGVAADVYGRLFLLPKLKEAESERRFFEVAPDYKRLTAEFYAETAVPGANPAYQWDSWRKNIRDAFDKGVPVNFLSMSVLAKTMVFGRKRGKKHADMRIEKVREVFGDEIAKRLLLEDYLGAPAVTDSEWMTSANRAHLASHLAHYSDKAKTHLWDAGTVLEWGAGYGCMARLLRRMNPGLTYIIVDLPELLALQYVYLCALEGASALNVATQPQGILKGKINFIPYESLVAGKVVPSCDAFISTWAVTESPIEAQKSVIDARFFSAKKVLLAYFKKDGNMFQSHGDTLGLSEDAIPAQPGNAYACR